MRAPISTGEAVGAILFLAAIVSVTAGTAWLLGTYLARRLRGRAVPKRSALRRWARRGVLVAAVLGAGCFAWGWFVEPYWLDQTHVTIHSDKLTPATAPVRIVHVSDIQCDLVERLEDELPSAVASMQPDAIVFTGDSTNYQQSGELFRRCLRDLAAIAPTYAVLGNVDLRPGFRRFFEGTGTRVLDGDFEQVRIGGADVCFVGAPAGRHEQLCQALRAAPDEALKVALYHYPGWVEEASWAGADLYLCGRTHGGQVRLPGYGALITFARHGKRYEAGAYQVGRTWMYVSRGVGLEGGKAPRVRFLCRPEVTLIEVLPSR